MAQDGGIRGHGLMTTVVGSATTLRGMQTTKETPQQKAQRVARKLDEIQPHLGNQHDGSAMGGVSDGKIEASVWNRYVDEHFNSAEEAKQGKHHVKDNISTADAIRSLNAYYAKGLEK